jgi:protein-disulfide isomerase-like protein with CxxC motif
MSEHTKEPWAGKEIPLTAVGLARAGFGIVFTNHTATRDEAEANARRIVASVNACAGIPTDVLEAMPSGPSSLLPMYAQIEQQRDKLLAALTEIAELDILKYHHAYAIAKVAIEEIEASK